MEMILSTYLDLRRKMYIYFAKYTQIFYILSYVTNSFRIWYANNIAAWCYDLINIYIISQRDQMIILPFILEWEVFKITYLMCLVVFTS